jgi:hypothetical protein
MFGVTDFYAAAKAAELTQAASWTPFGGSPIALDVIYTNDYNELYQAEGNRPMVRVPSALVPAIAQGDLITVTTLAGPVNFKVAAIHRDTPNLEETALLLSKT